MATPDYTRDLLAEDLTEDDLATLFPEISLEADDRPPEEDEFRLVDDLVDFAADDADVDELDDDVTAAQAHPARDLAMDWDSEELFTLDGGEPERPEDEDSVIEWANKFLHTPRGEFPIYGDDYGTRLHKLPGAGLPTNVLHAEIAREIEGLSQHSRIASAEVGAIMPLVSHPGALLVSILMALDTGDEEVQLDITVA